MAEGAGAMECEGVFEEKMTKQKSTLRYPFDSPENRINTSRVFVSYANEQKQHKHRINNIKAALRFARKKVRNE